MWLHKEIVRNYNSAITHYKYVARPYQGCKIHEPCSLSCVPKLVDSDVISDDEICLDCNKYHADKDTCPDKPQTKGNGMNYSTAVFLINDDCRMVKCTYEPESKSAPKPSTYMFKTFDKSIQVGDFVVIPTDTRHGMTVVKVAEVDVEFDPETPLDIKWVIGKVDNNAYTKLLDQEKEMIVTIQSAEKRRKKDELKAALFKDNEEKMKALQIAHVAEPEKK